MSRFIRFTLVMTAALLFCGVAVAQQPSPYAKNKYLSIQIKPTKGGPGEVYFNVEVVPSSSGAVFISLNASYKMGSAYFAKQVDMSTCTARKLIQKHVYNCWVNARAGQKIVWRFRYAIPRGGFGAYAQAWMTDNNAIARKSQISVRREFK